jgi:hypothetical protein
MAGYTPRPRMPHLLSLASLIAIVVGGSLLQASSYRTSHLPAPGYGGPSAIQAQDVAAETRIYLPLVKRTLVSTYLPLVCDLSRPNLLANPDFEGEYFQFAHFGSILVADKWLPWWVPQAPDDPPWKNRMPEYGPAAPDQDRIHSGSSAQRLFTYYGTHVGGVYQRVSHLLPGTRLRFSIWGQAWAGEGDDPGQSVGGGPMHMRVGIDPYGGTNPFAADIVWSEEQNPLDTWAPFAVEAVANGDRITVFTYSAPEYPTRHNDVFWDDASLVRVEPSVPPPGSRSR